MDDFDFSDVTLTIKCTQCQEISVKPIMELVGKDFTPCNRCGHPINLKDEVRQTAIGKTLERAREVKSKLPRQ